MIRSPAVWLVFGIFSLLAAGCTSGVQPVEVSGTVALDGKPVPKGRIIFSANDGSPPEMVTIKEGNFVGKVMPGKKRVEIMAERKTGRRNTFYPDEEELENFIPARYNLRSELNEDLPPGGKSGLKYDLKSK